MTDRKREDDDAKETLQRMSMDVLRAICAHDTAALALGMTDDFVFLGVGQRQDRREFLEAVGAGEFRTIDATFEHFDVEILGDAAVVSGVQRVTVALAGGSKAVSRAAFTDVFVRRWEGWLLRVACSNELP